MNALEEIKGSESSKSLLSPEEAEKKVYARVQILSWPDCFVRAIKDNPDWTMKNLAEEWDNPNYEFRYKGELVIHIGRYHGFGWGCNASYPTLSLWTISKLKLVIPQFINYW